MGAFIKTTKVCAVAALGLSLSVGAAVVSVPEAASAATGVSAVQGRAPIEVTSPLTYKTGGYAVLEGTAEPGVELVLNLWEIGRSERVTPGADGHWKWSSERPVPGASQAVNLFQKYGWQAVDKQIRIHHSDDAADGERPGHIRDLEITTQELTYPVGGKLVLEGTAMPNSGVSVDAYATGFTGGYVVADAKGNWRFESEGAMRGTRHDLRVRQSHPDNEQQKTVTVRAVNEDGSEAAFAPIAVDTPSYRPFERLRLSGTATPGTSVVVDAYSAGIVGEQVKAAADGSWSFTSRSAVRGFEHDVRVRQDGPLGADSSTFRIVAPTDGTAPVFRKLERTSSADYTPGTATRVEGLASPWAQIVVRLTNAGGKPVPGQRAQQFIVNSDASGRWAVDLPAGHLTAAEITQDTELQTGDDSISFVFTER